MLNIPLTKSLLRTTDNYISALEKGGIKTVGDLLLQFPREYDDRTQVLDSFSYVNVKEKNTIVVKLLTITNQKTANNKLLTKAVFEDKNGFMAEGVWFNRKYLASQLQSFIGKQILLSGKVKYAFGKITFQSPDTETDLKKIQWEIVPVYSDINYIPSKWTAPKIELLKSYISDIEDELPENIIKKYNFISRKEAIYKIHFPRNSHEIDQAKFRLGYEELFEINYKAISSKYKSFAETEGLAPIIKMNPEYVKEVIKEIGFELTDHQKIVVFQVLKDMEKSHWMQRLLEWDVGTWKTVVALIIALHAMKEYGSRLQVAIMAPTEILARQHFEWMQELFMKFGVTSHLLVWSLTAKQKSSVKADIKSWNIDVVIGTHALVQDDIRFHNLGFVVIDEQHRFWVKQREMLEKFVSIGEDKKGIMPHVLNMTATPIPRTLALTLYGDQDLSIISQYPKGRKDIFTKVARDGDPRMQVESFVRSELEKWRQAFWISPLVEESEKIDLANAVNTFENLKEIFYPHTVWLLHWKMKASEKDAVMNSFAAWEIQVLSSTSVVEVWVNVPNATIMCIEWAERFWLSQLHQFRWRVGRWKHQSYCYLFPSKGNSTDRLKAMERTNNGFELAEIDLEIRGPGEVYGLRQSWVPDLKVASLTDLELISQIREDISEMFEEKK